MTPPLRPVAPAAAPRGDADLSARRAQALYDRLARGDVAGLLPALSAGVLWDHGAGGALPVTRTLRGRRAVAEALRDPVGHAAGGAAVLRVVGSGPEAAALVEMGPPGAGRLELHLWTFGADGRVARLRRVAARAADLAPH